MKREAVIVIFLFITCECWNAFAEEICTEVGRFPDTTDPTCQKYILCVLDPTTATPKGYSYTCPDNAVFNADKSVCSDPSNYECIVPTTASPCDVEGFIADPDSTDCTTYLVCYSENNIISSEKWTCPNSYFNPNVGYCVVEYNCPSRPFKCQSAGHFANTADATCQSFFLCVLSNKRYLQYSYKCPATSKFHPDNKVCTSSYQCS